MLPRKQFIIVFVNSVMMVFTIFETLNSTSDMKTLCIDSTSVKAHQHSCGTKKSKASQDIGNNRGGKTTHTITDKKGIPLCFKLSSSNKNDCTQAVAILKYLPLNGSNILADKAYREIF